MLFRDRQRELWRICCVALAFALGANVGTAADLSRAVVRQKVNVVTVAPSITAAPRPAATGSVIADENVVRTGKESRAELEFSDQTLARLGANSIFSFDAKARSMSCEQGAILFAKPTGSGKVEVRAGAITAAITGSTGFVLNRHAGGKSKSHQGAGAGPAMLGMLEGKLHGTTTWHDSQGREQTFHFTLGPGEMILAHPDRRPAIVQFDIPRFVKTSPLLAGYKSEIPNAAQLNKAIADYNSDTSRGFVDSSSSPSTQFGWMGSINRNSFDASVSQLSHGATGGGSFVDVGGTGVIRGQLIWETFADLDLHLFLPSGQEVFYANTTVSFNNGQAMARLDHDNRGGTIDVLPNRRVENIAITGLPSAGAYQFFVNSFSTPNASDFFTLTISGGGRTQTISGNLGAGQTSQMLTVNFPGGR